ncbi:MAG: hexapeptide repeat-containing transferase [Puniceicoccaceae bacterium 5H]|nr:MAG: hexapeptide repeat-containing transferase [Puniceicoccaceae bacterium 5H]
MSKRLLVFGAGNVADVVSYYFKSDSPYEIAAFVVDGEFLRETSFLGRPVVAWEEAQQTFSAEEHRIFVALGPQEHNQLRASKLALVEAAGYEPVSYISSRSGIPSILSFGSNCLILEHQAIQPGARLGKNVFVWNNVLIGHHSFVGDNCWLDSMAAVGASVTVGDGTRVGINATVADKKRIGTSCAIAPGAVVTHHLPAGATVHAPQGIVTPAQAAL